MRTGSLAQVSLYFLGMILLIVLLTVAIDSVELPPSISLLSTAAICLGVGYVGLAAAMRLGVDYWYSVSFVAGLSIGKDGVGNALTELGIVSEVLAAVIGTMLSAAFALLGAVLYSHQTKNWTMWRSSSAVKPLEK